MPKPGDTLLDSDDDDKDADDMRPDGKARKPIEQLLSEGQELMVQISKGPIGTKGPRVTTYVSLARTVSRVHAERGAYRRLAPHCS